MISLHPVANLLPTSGAIAAPKVSITIQRLQPRLVPSKDSRGLLLSKTIIMGFAQDPSSSINLTHHQRLTQIHQLQKPRVRPRARRRPPPWPPHMGTCRWPPRHWASRHRCRPRRHSLARCGRLVHQPIGVLTIWTLSLMIPKLVFNMFNGETWE